MKFNINYYVRVKLNDHGRSIHRKNFDKIFLNHSTIEYRPPKEDEDGYSKFQLWDLMREFGEYMGLGLDNPFDTEIDIVEGQS
jgi:hypothetical protein